MKFLYYKQLDSMDCGPSCLRMVAKFYGKSYSLESIRSKSYITKSGVSMLGISDAAEDIGFRTRGYRLTREQLRDEVPRSGRARSSEQEKIRANPCSLWWKRLFKDTIYYSKILALKDKQVNDPQDHFFCLFRLLCHFHQRTEADKRLSLSQSRFHKRNL
jgi:hypothetical protein